MIIIDAYAYTVPDEPYCNDCFHHAITFHEVEVDDEIGMYETHSCEALHEELNEDHDNQNSDGDNLINKCEKCLKLSEGWPNA
jgi:hypothetical protein